MNSYTPHDPDVEFLLAEMEEHLVEKCRECTNHEKDCGNPLSICGYSNCLRFGLFLSRSKKV
jgi:hypothetical protein